MLRFTLNTDDSLSLEANVLVVCGQLNWSDNYDSEKLPNVEPSVLFKRITAHSWYKANDFDSDRPSKIDFKSNGEYVAEYNNAECSYSGFWSVRGKQMVREFPKNSCSWSTDRKRSFTIYSIKFIEDLLLFEGALYSANQNQQIGTFGGDLFPSIVEMNSTFQRPIQNGVKNMFNVELRNVSEDKVTLINFIVSQQQFEKQANGNYGAVGSKNILASKNFTSLTLLPGQTYRFPLEVTISGSGRIAVTIDANFADKIQSYSGYEYHILEL